MTPAEIEAEIESEEQFLVRWAGKLRPPFSTDGAVDPAVYWNEPRRIVFVLKEVNVRPGEDLDLRGFLRDGGLGKTWNVVSYWSHGLRNGLPRLEEVPEANAEFRSSALRRVAVVNLNKKGGGSTSSHRAIRAAARLSADDLREQVVEVLKPHLIVCGGTGGILRDDVLGLPGSWETMSADVSVSRQSGSVPPMIWAHHPQARKRHDLLYGSVMAAARNLGLA